MSFVRRATRLIAFVFVVAAVLGSRTAEAKWQPHVLTPQVQATVLKQYGRLLRRGALVLVERKANGKLRQVMIMRWLRAPLAKVYKTIAQMEKYPSFLPNVRKVKILKRSPKSFEASMTTAVAMIQMSWVTRVKMVSPRRIEMRTLRGDVRGGGWSWRLVPVGPKGQHTAIFGSYYSEIQQGSWILRWMLKQMPGMDIAVNLGAGISFVEAALRQAEGRVKGRLKASSRRKGWKIRPPFTTARQIKGLAPLLKRGDLALIESFADGTFKQASLIAPIGAKQTKVYRAVKDVANWKRWFRNVRKVRIRSANAKRIRYKIWIKVLPFYTLKTRHRMQLHPQLPRHILMQVVGGSIKRARYQYRFFPSPLKRRNASVFVYSLYVDLRSTSGIIRTMFAANKEVEHGINIATAVIWLNALRRHVER